MSLRCHSYLYILYELYTPPSYNRSVGQALYDIYMSYTHHRAIIDRTSLKLYDIYLSYTNHRLVYIYIYVKEYYYDTSVLILYVRCGIKVSGCFLYLFIVAIFICCSCLTYMCISFVLTGRRIHVVCLGRDLDRPLQ